MAVVPETPARTDNDLVAFVKQLFTEARREKRRRLDKWTRYDRMLHNQMWGAERAAWLPSPSSSEFFPTVSTLVAWMTDQPPVMFVSPDPDLSQFATPPDPALVGQKADDMQSYLQSWWLTNGANPQMESGLIDTFTFGSGIVETGWNPFALDGKGDISMRRRDPWCILPDPMASGIDDDSCAYILDVEQVRIVEILRQFPERGHLVVPSTQAPDMDVRPKDRSGFELIDQQGLAATGVTGLFPGTSTPGIPPLWGADHRGPFRPEDYTGSALLIKCWLRDTNRVTIPVIDHGQIVDEITVDAPCWRFVAMANNVILTPDTSNPFDHGQCPYIRIPMMENGEFWSIPLSEHIWPPQVALNRLLAAGQTSVELTGNPVWLESDKSGVARTKITNRPGGRVGFNAGHKPEWMQPPSMSSDFMNLVAFWRDTIDRISGISAVARGAALRRREPAQAVDAVQEASFVRVRAVLRNMEEALRKAGNQLASNLVQFQIEPRAVPLVGEAGSDEFLQLSPRHFTYPEVNKKGDLEEIPLKFSVWIEAGSSQPISRSARVAEYDALRMMNPPQVDTETLLGVHRIPHADKVMANLEQEQQKQVGMAQQMAAGQG